MPGSNMALGDLSDVTTSGVRAGDSLVWDGTRWIPAPAAVSPIAVTASWATAANAKTDIETATGMVFPADTANMDIFLALWEGTGDPDDFAVLLVKDTPTYTATNGVTAAFSSAPTTGTAYVIGTQINMVIA